MSIRCSICQWTKSAFDGAYSRPVDPPVSSDTVLVTHTDYGSNGMPSIATDPRGIQSLTQYDLLGRTTETIGAFTPSTGSGQAVPTDSTNQTTAYTFDGNDDVLTMTAVMPSAHGSRQITEVTSPA